MIDKRNEWQRSRDTLVSAMKSLGFSKELGEVIAKHLGSPKAIDRMTAYLNYVKPRTELLHLFVKSSVALYNKSRTGTRSTGFLNQIVTRIKSDTPSDNK